MKLLTSLIIACFLSTTNVEARLVPESVERYFVQKKCTLRENATMSVSFSGKTTEIIKNNSLLDEKTKEITEIAQKNGVEIIKVNNKQININSNNDTELYYQYYGNISFEISPLQKSYILLEILGKKKYNVSLTGNIYNEGDCQN